MGVTPLRLGELLVKQGRLTSAQLASALQEQRTTKEFLGALCVRKGWVSDADVLEALAEQFNLPRVELESEPLDARLLGQFAPALLKDHHCVPMRLEGSGTIVIAIANPLDVWAVSELERQAGARRVRLVLALPKEIDAAVARLQQQLLQATQPPASGGRR
jgi:type IV pilus assembly protein PilB